MGNGGIKMTEKNDNIIQDIEDENEISNEKITLNFWEKKQRELLSSVVDYNLESLSQLVSNKTINLSPNYQRRFRWDDIRKSKLIESFLMNVPVPPIFLNEDKYGKYSVIDGKQRLSAINEFMTGKLVLTGLEIFSDINNMSLHELPVEFQNVIKTRSTLRSIIILRQSDTDVKFEVFQRLNTGGISLNAQEIRNSTYPGPLNDLILELSENKDFHQMLGIKNKAKSSIYQEMKDAELILRYLTFRGNWENYSGGLKRNLDNFMVNNQNMNKLKLKEAKKDFIDTLNIVKVCFGEGSFKRWLPENNRWKNMVSVPIYDAQIFACSGYTIEQVVNHSEAILEDYKNLFIEDREFIKAIESSTGKVSSFLYRINAVKEVIDKYVEGV